MVIENLDIMALQWLGERVTNFIDNNLDAAVVAGAVGLYGFLKNDVQNEFR